MTDVSFSVGRIDSRWQPYLWERPPRCVRKQIAVQFYRRNEPIARRFCTMGMGNHSKFATPQSMLATVLLLTPILCLLFWRSFDPAYVLFSNDNPLGQVVASRNSQLAGFTGVW